MDLPTAIQTLKTSNPIWWEHASSMERSDVIERLIRLTDRQIAKFRRRPHRNGQARELWALVAD